MVVANVMGFPMRCHRAPLFPPRKKSGSTREERHALPSAAERQPTTITAERRRRSSAPAHAAADVNALGAEAHAFVREREERHATFLHAVVKVKREVLRAGPI